MKRQIVCGLAVLALCAMCGWERPVGAVADGNRVCLGVFELSEVSGAAMLPGNRLLAVTDEDKGVYLLEHVSQKLLSERLTITDKDGLLNNDSIKLDDLEDVALAWDGMSAEYDVYLVTSHSRNREGIEKPKRDQIVRLHAGTDGELKVLNSEPPGKLKKAMTGRLKSALERTPAQSGFNIEGAAWDPQGQLILGLRSPTTTISRKERDNEDAIVVRLKNPGAIFNNDPLQIQKVSLRLAGQGIRGMCFDNQLNGYWILSGLSPDPNYEVKDNWGLWFWDGTASGDGKQPDTYAVGNSPSEVMVPLAARRHLDCPEAVCRIDIDGQSYLLLIADGGKASFSKYALIPTPNSPLRPEPPSLVAPRASQATRLTTR